MTDTAYIICINRPGSLPEAEPTTITFETDLPVVPQVLEYIYDEILGMTPDDDSEYEPWGRLLDTITEDQERAADFSDEGFLYTLPDGYVFEATKVTA